MEIPGYEIGEQIGKGAMARVFLARHNALNRNVAIKVMNRQQGADSDFAERFLREARIVANLTHPNIVTIHDVGEQDGHNYLVMELLPGGKTLRDKIGAGVDSKYALSIVRQVAVALQAAHEKNIVHRDIKPDNIMFRADGSVVLMDFGVARSVDSAATQMTQAGLIIGTPKYISPEQAQGRDVGSYSDIYSLGVVFYEMLTGQAPYSADTPLGLALKHVTEPVPRLTGDLAVYQPLLDHMMAKTRDQRYSSCDQIIAEIDRLESATPAVRTTKKPRSPTVVTGNASAESLTIVEDIDAVNEKVNAEPLTLVKKDKTDAAARSKKGGAKSKLLLSTSLAALITAGAYMFMDIDIGKLQTIVGIDPGPVYSRVGRLISIPDGTYKMGNSRGSSTEQPVRTVRINGFRLGESEVTQKQWRLVMGSDASYFKGCDNCPVDSVSWNDVQTFLKRLNKQTGLHFRLPSEAEWEYACRSAGKDEKYCGGDDAGKLAWYGDNSGAKTHPVSQKQANGLGLYDMSGNLWEWTQDCWHNSYDGAPANARAWKSGTCKQRVLRGGSWVGVAGGLSSTGRLGASPANDSRNFGFRVAQDL
jgi:serine/threonine protein kinase